jgi:cellulose synthase/poly-beta-1,6-N-acetylglucosamine synthase-like glycosyltransferase
MADPFDDRAHAEAERITRLELRRVTVTYGDLVDALQRAWSGEAVPAPLGYRIVGAWRSLALALVLIALPIASVVAIFHEGLAPNRILALIALLCGLFFFAYALKYYITSAAVLAIALLGDSLVLGKKNGNGRSKSASATGPEHKEGYKTLRGEKLNAAGAVLADATPIIGESRLSIARQPFVSVQVALYNEARVVDRLLAACTSFDYENYEVLVADDSTDETIELLSRWRSHPRVKIVHRSSRTGFKGGALQEALRRMNPKAEYVMIFDADFIPPKDAIWHFLDYFGRLANGNGHAEHANGNGAPKNGDRLAAVQGYQWHMLNASENWITKGVRAEFAGSYVLERAAQELFGTMKMISGSVYMIRADVLRKLGWSTSITEDWELTIRLYLAGYKVLYTPYIQAPAECVSTIRRLIKQRMRWAEGHTYNVKKYFFKVLASPNLSWKEKVEFVYYAPYYLQSVVFAFGTVTWILSDLLLGQRLPSWSAILGWSLVVTNVLALPLMNLAGVLLEGSLRRDAAGLLSFIGLSWLLVPFQAYASVKGLLEREEGGWVRTPKSGRVTEALGQFKLAKLLPWELPKRRQRKRSRVAQLALTCFATAIAIAILGVGALSVRAAGATGRALDVELAIPTLLGTAVPLVLLGLGWLKLRQRIGAVAVAMVVALSVNVVFLAGTVPAEGVTDNSSVFTFARTITYLPSGIDMKQNYTPAGSATTCTVADASACTYFSDQYSAGQTMSAGNATADLYLSNSANNIVLHGVRNGGGNATSFTIFLPTGLQQGDLMLAAISTRGGSAVTISTDAGWTLIRRVDNGATLSLAIYWKVAGANEGDFHFTLGSQQKAIVDIIAYAGVDPTSPVDVENGQLTAAGTSHSTPSITTTGANEMVVAHFGNAATSTWTPPTGMTEEDDMATNLGGTTTNASIETDDVLQASAGATGVKTATSAVSAAGATHILALKPATTCGITATLKKVNPIALRAATTKTASGTSIVVNTPASQTNDVMLAYLSFTSGITPTAPSGWTATASTAATGYVLYTYRHVAGASEPSTYTWTFSASASIAAWAGSYSGVDTTTPVDLAPSSASTTGTTFTTATATPNYADEMIVPAFIVANNSTWTAPAGMTAEGNPIAGTAPSLAVFDGIQPLAASFSRTATASVSGSGVSTMIGLKPSVAPTTLGSGTISTGITGTSLFSTTFATSAVTFATGDRLQLDVVAGYDCSGALSYDGASQPSKLTVATVVPEGVAGLALLAPALPLLWRRRQRRRS